MYIGWPTNVNKIVLDSTNVTVGEGATVQDNLESGGEKKSRLVNANPADKFNVTMEFSFEEDSKDENNYTELDRFWIWYKYRHCYGTNPFKFPAILINSNHQEGNSVESREHAANAYNNQQQPVIPLTEADIPDTEYYKITSAANADKSGHCMRVSMTWETAATGPYTIPDDISEINRIEAHNGYVDVYLTSTPDTEPSENTWTVYFKKGNLDPEVLTINNVVFDGDTIARLYFTPETEAGTYTVTIGEETSQFVIEV